MGLKYSRPGAWKTDCAAGETGFPVKARFRSSHGERTIAATPAKVSDAVSFGRQAGHGGATQTRAAIAAGTTPAV